MFIASHGLLFHVTVMDKQYLSQLSINYCRQTVGLPKPILLLQGPLPTSTYIFRVIYFTSHINPLLSRSPLRLVIVGRPLLFTSKQLIKAHFGLLVFGFIFDTLYFRMCFSKGLELRLTTLTAYILSCLCTACQWLVSLRQKTCDYVERYFLQNEIIVKCFGKKVHSCFISVTLDKFITRSFSQTPFTETKWSNLCVSVTLIKNNQNHGF